MNSLEDQLHDLLRDKLADLVQDWASELSDTGSVTCSIPTVKCEIVLSFEKVG